MEDMVGKNHRVASFNNHQHQGLGKEAAISGIPAHF